MGGVTVLDVVNEGDSTFHLHTSVNFTATSTTTRLEFNGMNSNRGVLFGDVCVDLAGGTCGGTAPPPSGAPEPGTTSLLAAAAIAWVVRMRLRPSAARRASRGRRPSRA